MMLVRPISGAQTGARGELVLSDGSAVCVRSVSSGDVERLRRMFSRSSPGTIYRRFHSPYPRVPGWALERLGNLGNVDHRDAEFLVGTVCDEVVGHAMYVRAGDGREAEAAVVVEDRWQSRGIGKLLLSRLAAEARWRGIEVFVCVTLAENRRAFLLVASVFDEVGYALEGGSYVLRAPLRSLKPRDDVVERGWSAEEKGSR